MRKTAVFKMFVVRVVTLCVLFCTVVPCHAQETARGIVAEKTGGINSAEERPEPEIYFASGQIGSNRIEWSADEKYIATFHNYNQSTIWNVSEGKEIYSFKEEIDWIPNSGNFLLGKEIWNTSARKKVISLGKYEHEYIHLCGTTGNYYISSHDDVDDIIHLKTGKKCLTFNSNFDICFFDSDKKCVIISENEIEIWNVEKGEKIKSYPYKKNYFYYRHPCSVSQNGLYLAVQRGSEREEDWTGKSWIDIIDFQDGHKLFSYSTIFPALYLTWSPNSKYLLIYGGMIDRFPREPMTIYNVDTQKIIRIDDLNEEGVTWSFDSNYFTAGGNIIDVVDGSFNKDFFDDSKNITASAFSPTGTLLANLYDDGSIEILNYKTKEKINSISHKLNVSNIEKILGITDNEICIQYELPEYEGHQIAKWNISSGILDDCRINYFYEGDTTVSHSGKYAVAKDWHYNSTVKIRDLGNDEMGIDTGYTIGTYTGRCVTAWNQNDTSVIILDGKNICLFDINTKKLQKSVLQNEIGGSYGFKAKFSPTGNYVAVFYEAKTYKDYDYRYNLGIYDSNDLSLILSEDNISWDTHFSWQSDDEFLMITYTEYDRWGYKKYFFDLKHKIVNEEDFAGKRVYCSSHDGKYIITDEDYYRTNLGVWDVNTLEKKRTLTIENHAEDMYLTPDNRHLVIATENSIMIFDFITGEKEATMLLCPDGEWLTYTPEGFFCGSEWATQNLVYIVDGMDVIGIDQVYDTYYRPDLVAAKIRGEDISSYASAVQLASLVRSGRAPAVSLSGIPSESSGRDMTFGVCVRNTGGGIGAVNLLLNGKAIRLSDGVASSDGETVEFRHTVTLQNGSNTLEAFALNGAGLVESVRSSAEVVWRDATEKPDLYVLTAAVNRYRDKSLWLNFAVPDAQAVAEGFQKQQSGLYRSVHVFQLNDGDVTKENLAAEFSRLSEKIRADDVFVFFVSGHGTTYDDGDYYYLPSDFRYTSKDSIPAGGISKNDLLTNLSKIKAGKTLVMLDTCNSGAFVSDIGQRGLSEKTAIDRLTRATGHATLAASSDTQAAMEGYNGHGVFTYVFLEGIAGAADSDGDGYVTLNELSAFVEREVPERSYEKWGYEQVPQKDLRRQDFPIAGK